MKKGDLLFVYGTLRVGAPADLSSDPRLRFVQTDIINGELFDIGWFPGLKTTPGHFCVSLPYVRGDVFEILDEACVAALDAYEGYPSLYGRTHVETVDGLHPWVYVYNGSVSDRTLVGDGDWLRYAKMKQTRAFG